MLRLVNNVMIVTLLLVMPIQGIAASVSHLLCESSPAAGHLDMASDHHHDDGIAAHDHDNGDNSNAEHQSCHQVATGMPSITVLAFASDLPVYHPSSFTSPSLFIPEQPQRPPRA